MIKRSLLAAAGVAVAGLIVASVGLASPSAPSGQVMYGHTSFDPTTGHFVGGGGAIEPAYDDSTGLLTYIQTPNNVTVHPAKKMRMVNGLLLPVNVAPLYLVVYPKGFDPGSSPLNCAHLPEDNCPDHGNAVAGGAEGFAQAIGSTVYSDAGGVAGHDHLIGIASTGGDFNVIWEPVIVIFNNAAAVHRITTLSDLESSDVSQAPLPQLDFHCSAVSAASYNRGTPAPSVTPNPQ
jgi:hypothetical protein